MEQKYKIGDRVRIKDLDWYNKNKNEDGIIGCGNANFIPDMKIYCGDILTICDINEELSYYYVAGCQYTFKDEMIEGFVEEEVGLVDSLSSRWVNEFELPDGYIFKDENGNIINATKIVLEKKKKEYPKTYDECCKIIDYVLKGETIIGHKTSLLRSFQRLLICRDAYWTIAGEEMGLNGPWKPDWIDGEWKWCVCYSNNNIEFDSYKSIHHTFSFPTKEMRDAFYENFKEEIEICKELL